MKKILTVAMALGLVLTFSVSAFADRYIALSHGPITPKKLNAIVNAGGVVVSTIDELNIAVVESNASGFSVDGFSMAPDVTVKWINPEAEAADEGLSAEGVSFDPFLGYQWGHFAIQAPWAWLAGATGAGVRVAVLDDGIHRYHWDLYANLNASLSVSFVPGESWEYPGLGFSHGSHVSGTIAADDNGWGVQGVAPDAELVMVKVLDYSGSGDFSWLLGAIVYAADIEADVINMSLGASLRRDGWVDFLGTPDDESDDLYVGAAAINTLIAALNRATAYARMQGVTVVAAAGNDAADLDHTDNLVHVPSSCPNVISVSATAPIGWWTDPDPDFDIPTLYTNYGRSAIDFAAPGGTWEAAYSGNPYYVYDYILSTSGDWFWFACGTSMASPHVAGVAALIIGQNGGDMHPAQVEAVLLQSADDLGEPGNDPYFGAGRVNALNAVSP